MSDQDGKSPRIAIQLGNASGPPPHRIKSRARPVHGKRHRAHALHEESESEGEAGGEQQAYGRHVAITHYGPRGTSLDDEEDDGSEPRSKAGDGRDQRQDEDASSDRKARRHDSPAVESEPKDKPIKWGLTLNTKSRQSSESAKEAKSEQQSDASKSATDKRENEKESKTIDDEAMDALLGSGTPKRRKLDSDVATGEPRPEDYQAVPIDDFGATILKRFGWDGKMRGKVKEVTRHANLTGLGAKDAKGAEDLGAWNQKTEKKDPARPARLNDYQREERKRRERMDDRYRDSYKREREREREGERDRGRGR